MSKELTDETTAMMEKVKLQCKQGAVTIAEGVLLEGMIENMDIGNATLLKENIDQQFENWSVKHISPTDVSAAILRFATAGSLGRSMP